MPKPKNNATENTALNRIQVELTRLQQAAAPLEPDKKTFREMANILLDYIENMYEELPTAPAYRAFDPNDPLSFDQPFLETPTPLKEVLQRITTFIYEKGLKANSHFYMGYVPGGGLPPMVLASLLTAAMNLFMGSRALSPGLVAAQDAIIDWLRQEMGFPEGTDGDLTSGGSMAMLACIIAARQKHNIIEKIKTQKPVVYLTTETHHSVEKAFKIAGLENIEIRKVPVDKNYRMDVKQLAEMMEADKAKGLYLWMVVASAGTTNTGAVDPINDIADVCKKENMWLQIDGALGALFHLCPTGKKIITGLDRADGLTLDLHKLAGFPYGLAAPLVAEGALLTKAFALEGAYMQDSKTEKNSPSDKSAELSRPARALIFLMTFLLTGAAPFRALVEEKLLLAQYFREKLSTLKIPGIESIEIAPGDLSVVAFRFKPTAGNINQFNERFMINSRKDGQVLCSSTLLDKEWYIRFIPSSRAHQEHVDIALQFFERVAKQTLTEMNTPTLQTPAFELAHRPKPSTDKQPSTPSRAPSPLKSKL